MDVAHSLGSDMIHTSRLFAGGSDRWKRSVQKGEERIYVILCLKDQIIDMKLRGSNEKFFENIR